MGNGFESQGCLSCYVWLDRVSPNKSFELTQSRILATMSGELQIILGWLF